MLRKISDEWQTPRDLFDVLDKGGEYMGIPFKGFHFGIDLCATQTNSKCKEWCIDYLKDRARLGDLSDAFERNLIQAAFMNPPYSNPKPFIEKAWEDSKHCKIVCLVKCDPSTQWWATFWEYSDHREIVTDEFGDVDYIEYYTGSKPGCDYKFFPKRIKFDPPQQLINSGEVWKVGKKWVQKCTECWFESPKGVFCRDGSCTGYPIPCKNCKGKGYKELSGPTFPSALIIMDRRGI